MAHDQHYPAGRYPPAVLARGQSLRNSRHNGRPRRPVLLPAGAMASCGAAIFVHMLTIRIILALAIAATALAQNKGILLEDLTWQEAEKVLTLQATVVIP